MSHEDDVSIFFLVYNVVPEYQWGHVECLNDFCHWYATILLICNINIIDMQQ